MITATFLQRSEDAVMTTTYDVILGLDVGKSAHHGCALTAAGAKLYDRELPPNETALRDVILQF